MSLLSLPRAGSRSRRLVVVGAAATMVLLPAAAQAETVAPAPTAESSTVEAVDGTPVIETPGVGVATADASVTADDVADQTAESVTDGTSETEDTTDESATDGVGVAGTGETEGGATDETVTEETETVTEETEVSAEEPVPFPEIDPAALTGLFTPICDTGTLTGLTLQLDELSGLLEELQDSGFPVPEEAFSELPSGTIDIPLDDTTLGELATELNAASAEFAELGLADADLQVALAELPASIRADVETLLGELQTGTVQPATLRALLVEIFPCPVEVPDAPVAGEDVVYPGYAPTGGAGSDGGSPLALLGAGAALLAGGGLFSASALRSRAARA